MHHSTLQTRTSLALAALMFAATASAQQAAQTAASAATQQGMVASAPIVSPEVATGGAVTFRLAAPNAQKVMVTVEGGAKPFELQKNSAGVWELTTPPMQPEI